MAVIIQNKSVAKKKLEIESALIERLIDVLKFMMPAGEFTSTECRIGDVYGNKGSSLSVSLKSKTKGLWIDHATDASGNIIGLIAAHFDLNAKTELQAVLAKAEEILTGLDELSSGVPLLNKDSQPFKLSQPLIKVAEWDYLSADGAYICSVVRFEDSDGNKTIRPYNKLTGHYKVHPVPRPLHNLPGISQSDIVILVEGEKCSQALIDAGYCATTAMMGAKAPTDKTDWSPLKNKFVFIWADNDQPGKEYATNCAKAALAAGAKAVTFLVMPKGKPKGWDAADALVEDPAFDLESFLKTDVSKLGNDDSDDFPPQPIQSDATVEKLNKTHAVVSVSGQTFILREFVNEKGKPDITLCRLPDLRLLYASSRVVTSDLLNRTRDTCIIDAWVEMPNRRTYAGIVFAPQGAPDGYYNLFRGFPVPPIGGDCSLYLQHLHDNICRGNGVYYEYLLNWMAHMIQRPGELPGIAIVFRGAQGVGKGVATDELGRLVEPHYIALSGMEQLVGRFTAHLKDKLLVYANEATWGGNKAAEGALKAMITDPDSSVEQKFKDVVRIDNYKRIMVSSNEDWAVPISKDDRRFFVLDVGSTHKEDHAYFAAIIDQMRNGGSEALMHELMNRDLAGFNIRKMPQTPYNFDLKLLSMESSDQFIYEYLRAASSEDWDIYLRKSILHNEYLDWCTGHGKKHKLTASMFGKNLKRLIPSTGETKINSTSPADKVKRHTYHIFPNLDTCRSAFEKACKSGAEIWEL